MRIEEDIKLDYADVLFRPKRSTLSSRKDVELKRTYKFKYSNHQWMGIPIMAANMDGVGEIEVAKNLASFELMTCLTKQHDLKTIKRNSSIKGIEESDCVVLIGSNPRHEATMVNARIRKNFVAKKIPIMSFGNPGDLTYDYTIVGNTTEDIKKFVNKQNKASEILLKSKKPIIIIGESALELESGKFIFESIGKFLFENN